MLHITFPKFTGQRYFMTHFVYVLKIFEDLGCTIEEEERDGFVVTINGTNFLFDYADTDIPVESNLHLFKFHCSYEHRCIHPFPPVSFSKWSEYKDYLNLCKYKAEGNISIRQRPYANATLRRNKVRNILTKRYRNVVFDIIPQRQYWLDINNTMFAIFVPGFCNNMIDRAQLQLMALGCCTISPEIPELLPFGKKFIEGVHYIKCKDDYSDLIDLIEFHSCFKEQCIQIGENAKELFAETSTPESVGKWIKEVLKKCQA